MLGPLAGGWIIAQHLGSGGVLGMLGLPVAACAALVPLLPRVGGPTARA